MSSIDLESFAKKEIPGPLHKYQLNHKHVEPRVPVKVNFNKAMGRDNHVIKNAQGPIAPTVQRIKKDKTAGPGSYETEKAMLRISSMSKIPNVSCISGMSMLEG